MDSATFFTHDSPGCYHVYLTADNGKIFVGEILMGDDGMWSYWPDEKRCGGFPGWMLMWIADKIFELNEPMEKSIEEYFGEQNDKSD